MKTFDISKNIILAFIILISVALKLSAHGNTTSLISSDNISSEKDKKTENISKRNLPSKKILCYERNKKDILDYILPGIYVAIGALLSWLTSHIIECKRKERYLEAIKKELEANQNHIRTKWPLDWDKQKKEDLISKLKETALDEAENERKTDYFIHLSDSSWNQYKYVIGDKVKEISKAYMLIGDINILVHASFYTNPSITFPKLREAIVNAEDAINNAINELNLLTKECCFKRGKFNKNE